MRGLTITTARTSIRPLGTQDAPLYCRLFTDEQTMRFIAAPLSDQRAMLDFRAALRAADRDPLQELFFSIRDNTTEGTVGICSIQRIDPLHRRAEVGLMLHPQAQRAGLGKEVVAALTRTALDTLPVTEIWAQYSTDNEAAAALFHRLGFQVMRQEAVDGHATHVRKQTWSLYSSKGPNSGPNSEPKFGTEIRNRNSSQGMSSIVMSHQSAAKKGD
jgi:RimJ/RimL family protein N-acetyltransferase